MLEILTTTNILNAGLSRNTAAPSSSQNSDTDAPLNAFGIGQANQPEPELSAQARILQQTDENQRELREGLDEARAERREQEESEEDSELDTSGFVRLSSSEGIVQRNNLPAERAVEIYRSVQNLV